MRIELTRDSVAMGDDADAPHTSSLEVPQDASVRQALAAIGVPRAYLATIMSDRATWIARAGDGTALAVVAQQWPEPRLLPAGEGPLARFADPAGTVRLDFEYRQQNDPDAEYERLAQQG
ncbi:hypothetical protein [Kitasatospora aureofaciens]|uniref:hypothetical protein n=1 Tax=Kitasatospora aureofaciens TaxID=1894 RepID=UPI001C46C52E|nr:hypothetical protein [Kitasatospora aureofaciens]MBV6699116.1 hypothetical protein [Kitasatospora aureofaciens]